MLPRRSAAFALLLPLISGLIGCTGADSTDRPAPASTAAPAPSALRVEIVAAGLEHPWDIGFLPDGTTLVSQRPGRLALLADHRPGALVRPVRADFGDVLAEGEGGLMGLLVHPSFAANRRFLTCQTHQENGTPVDIRLITWRLSEDGSRADRVGNLLTGLPVNRSGRHSGCRLALAEDGALLVSTGDTARPAIAQDRGSLGGKVLRVNIDTGAPLPDNPFIASPNPSERLLYTYGHRNPQGVAPRPGGQVFVAEHGPDVDDEINLLRPGGNYGWDPSRGGTESSYDESVPMTDLRRFPDAVKAVWSSGDRTEAVCAATFLIGPQWKRFDGMLAVTALKGRKLLLFGVQPDGSVHQVEIPPELDDTHGRLRAARQGPDGALYITTSNGTDDKVLRITAS
ncbi:sorbosone dehydrogenase family protein [Saccharopolyspora sp. ASAGF58]|uniref:PQQ-dependent sugar dehydrogenase n=1 Tax=Saccharopolyspora sp. ASAGF58 TaxID=2719023 RepID=UPI00143FDC50|nr:PQQ-dependent sugar dehydrogenase [Saccharopolyspora sp. ASAGF58]QIZ39539.1 PQQ-dependent sugar dehydrogenase [Saccharopolyspora sp. ASAGF58]